jgi:hypothetical protein
MASEPGVCDSIRKLQQIGYGDMISIDDFYTTLVAVSLLLVYVSLSIDQVWQCSAIAVKVKSIK